VPQIISAIDGRRPKHIVVTGGAGFIGSHVCEALLDRGDKVVALDNFDPYYAPAIKRGNVAWALRQPRYRLVEGDIRDPQALEEAFGDGQVDGVIHLAARAGVRPSIVDPLLYDSVNVFGTTCILEEARRRGIKSFVFGSSSSVYGASSAVPFSEDEVAAEPSSPYAATKRASELACYAYHHLYDLDITCLRFFTVYGPRQRPEMAIHKFVRLIDAGAPIDLYGDGASRRDYTYVDDIVIGILAALDRSNGYRILNLGTTQTTRLIDLIVMIARKLDRQAEIRSLPDQPGDVPITYADVSRAKALLDYRATTSLTDGLDHFISWYRAAAHIRRDVVVA